MGKREIDLLKPLDGIKVLSAARLLPGSYCTLLLAYLGADITMIENPIGGDTMRLRPTFFSAMSRGKKSITLNLKTEKGKAICYQLAKQSDVFIESFRPGVVERLGIDYVRMKKINPEIIYTSITGFGQKGPYSRFPGHDLMYQGIAGMLADRVEQNNLFPPLVPIADLSSAMFAAISILGSLYGLSKSQGGRYLDISMTDGLVSWMSIFFGTDDKIHSEEPMAGRGIYKTADGKYIALAIDEERHFWENFCKVIGREDLAELSSENRRTNYQSISDALKMIFLTKTCNEWVKLFMNADVPIGPVYSSTQEIFADPQLSYRGMVEEANVPLLGKTRDVGSPFKIFVTPSEINLNVPSLGEHTSEILLQLGHSQKEIEDMKDEGII